MGRGQGRNVLIGALAALASFALEELAQDAGGVQSDKAWRDHLARLAATSDYVPQLPSTLQAGAVRATAP